MNNYFTDLHIHVGINEQGKWVKIPTSKELTLRNILREAACRKGMQIIGIVDAMSPLVQHDLDALVDEGLLTLDSQGGYRYDDKLTLILGAEIETTEPGGGSAHTLIYLPDAELMTGFARTMSKHIRNIHLSSQNAHMSLSDLIKTAGPFAPLIVPAHIFTPHKGLLGSCTDRIKQILSEAEMRAITAVELGLSADSDLADRIGELTGFTFLSNSDAHSPEKIAREYNILTLEAPTFTECAMALRRTGGRKVAANYGLDPRLGKYHRTFCPQCDYLDASHNILVDMCPQCGSKKIVRGVFDRIDSIADFRDPQHPEHRPPYCNQIPLSFIPGLGKKGMDKLLAEFGTEMNVLHQATREEIAGLVGDKITQAIFEARSGTAAITAGGGGVYGKLAKN